jgi:hypothetical protein
MVVSYLKSRGLVTIGDVLNAAYAEAEDEGFRGQLLLTPKKVVSRE